MFQTFVLGGRYAVVGTKGGALQAFSLATGEKVCEAAAHGGSVAAFEAAVRVVAEGCGPA